MSKLYPRSITAALLILVLTAVLISLSVTLLISMGSERNILVERELRSLSLINGSASRQISAYLDELQAGLLEEASHPWVASAMDEFLASSTLLEADGVSAGDYIRRQYIDNNPNPANRRDLPDSGGGTTAHTTACTKSITRLSGPSSTAGGTRPLSCRSVQQYRSLFGPERQGIRIKPG